MRSVLRLHFRVGGAFPAGPSPANPGVVPSTVPSKGVSNVSHFDPPRKTGAAFPPHASRQGLHGRITVSRLGDLLGRIFGGPKAAAAPPPPVAGSLQDRWLLALNGERAAAGLRPMAADPLLAESADEWAGAMAHSGELSHGDFEGRIAAAVGLVDAAEDVAAGAADVAAVTALWMSSPPHRMNILGNYNRTGIGRSASSSGIVYFCARLHAGMRAYRGIDPADPWRLPRRDEDAGRCVGRRRRHRPAGFTDRHDRLRARP